MKLYTCIGEKRIVTAFELQKLLGQQLMGTIHNACLATFYHQQPKPPSHIDDVNFGLCMHI